MGGWLGGFVQTDGGGGSGGDDEGACEAEAGGMKEERPAGGPGSRLASRRGGFGMLDQADGRLGLFKLLGKPLDLLGSRYLAWCQVLAF